MWVYWRQQDKISSVCEIHNTLSVFWTSQPLPWNSTSPDPWSVWSAHPREWESGVSNSFRLLWDFRLVCRQVTCILSGYSGWRRWLWGVVYCVLWSFHRCLCMVANTKQEEDKHVCKFCTCLVNRVWRKFGSSFTVVYFLYWCFFLFLYMFLMIN